MADVFTAVERSRAKLTVSTILCVRVRVGVRARYSVTAVVSVYVVNIYNRLLLQLAISAE